MKRALRHLAVGRRGARKAAQGRQGAGGSHWADVRLDPPNTGPRAAACPALQCGGWYPSSCHAPSAGCPAPCRWPSTCGQTRQGSCAARARLRRGGGSRTRRPLSIEAGVKAGSGGRQAGAGAGWEAEGCQRWGRRLPALNCTTQRVELKGHCTCHKHKRAHPPSSCRPRTPSRSPRLPCGQTWQQSRCPARQADDEGGRAGTVGRWGVGGGGSTPHVAEQAKGPPELSSGGRTAAAAPPAVRPSSSSGQELRASTMPQQQEQQCA